MRKSRKQRGGFATISQAIGALKTVGQAGYINNTLNQLKLDLSACEIEKNNILANFEQEKLNHQDEIAQWNEGWDKLDTWCKAEIERLKKPVSGINLDDFINSQSLDSVKQELLKLVTLLNNPLGLAYTGQGAGIRDDLDAQFNLIVTTLKNKNNLYSPWLAMRGAATQFLKNRDLLIQYIKNQQGGRRKLRRRTVRYRRQ
jgi:hypothetical protein